MGAVTRTRHFVVDLTRSARALEGRAEEGSTADGDLVDAQTLATDQAYEDQQLMLAAQRGSREAFTVVLERHQTFIYGYLRSRLLEPADAEDLCQDVFLRCYCGRARFDGAAPVRPWLIGVARNVLREHMRATHRRRQVAWTELCLELETMVEPEDGMYDDVLGHLPTCLESLGQSARNALEMHYRDKLKLAEIGDKLRRSMGAVKLLMYRSRLAVRRCIDGKIAPEGRV